MKNRKKKKFQRKPHSYMKLKSYAILMGYRNVAAFNKAVEKAKNDSGIQTILVNLIRNIAFKEHWKAGNKMLIKLMKKRRGYKRKLMALEINR